MKKPEVEIAGKTVIDLVMEPDILLVDEVLVVAYGTTKRSFYRICKFC